MFKGDTMPGILVTLFGGAFFTATYLNPKLTAISMTSDGVPGAGFFPYILSCAIILLGLILTIRGIKQHGTVHFVLLDEEGKLNVKILLLSLLGLLAVMLIWRYVGFFFVCVFLFCLYLNFLFKRTFKFNILYSVIFTGFVYLVFSVGFSVQFGL